MGQKFDPPQAYFRFIRKSSRAIFRYGVLHLRQSRLQRHAMTPQELLVECLDALTLCPNGREQHRAHVREALASAGLSEGIQSALQLMDQRFSMYRRGDPQCMFVSRDDQDQFERQIAELTSALNLPRYVYHGTTAGRLQSICAEGLLPGRAPVWQGASEEEEVLRLLSDDGVFFAQSWRSAMHTWAYVAHLRSRGRKDSLKRVPAVIRMPATGLDLEKDPCAATPCWMVRERVPVEGAEVIVGLDTSFPQWQSIDRVVSMHG